MPVGGDQERYPKLQQGDQRSRVSLMRSGSKTSRGVALLAGAMIVFTSPTAPVRAQAAATTGNLVDQLVGPETAPDIDLAAWREQAAERIKSRADVAPLKRPPIAPGLLKLPQYGF